MTAASWSSTRGSITTRSWPSTPSRMRGCGARHQLPPSGMPCGASCFRSRIDRVCLRASMNPEIPLGRHILLPPPVSVPGAVRDVVHELSVLVSRVDANRLALTYRLTGDLDALQLPELRPPVRTDGLW